MGARLQCWQVSLFYKKLVQPFWQKLWKGIRIWASIPLKRERFQTKWKEGICLSSRLQFACAVHFVTDICARDLRKTVDGKSFYQNVLWFHCRTLNMKLTILTQATRLPVLSDGYFWLPLEANQSMKDQPPSTMGPPPYPIKANQGHWAGEKRPEDEAWIAKSIYFWD